MFEADYKPKRTYEENMALAKERIKKSQELRLNNEENKETTSKEIQKLPEWQERYRGIPNAILRSALFGAIGKGPRAFLQRVKKATLEGITIIQTGPTLDQTDLDVWEHCLHLARITGLDTNIEFTTRSFLKEINRSCGGNDIEWLKDTFARLASSVVEITDGQYAYFGSLIIYGKRDDKNNEYELKINSDIAKLFYSDGWTSIEYDTRNALKKPLSRWLYCFYSTHVKPYAMKIETIHNMCGSESKDKYSFKQELKEALKQLEEITGWKWKIDDKNLVHIKKTTGTTSQTRNLQKQISTTYPKKTG